MAQRDYTTVAIGPPNSMIGGMNTTVRRQQLPASVQYLLRNYRLKGEAWRLRDGMVRIATGTRLAKSLSSSGAANSFLTIPYQDDSINITDYNLGRKFTIFASFRADDLADDVMIAGQSDDVAPPWRIWQATDKKINAVIEDTTTAVATLESTATYGGGKEVTVQLVRDGADATLIVNGETQDTADNLDPDGDLKVSTEAIFLGSWTGRGSGSQATWYEFRMFRRAETSSKWRVTQYPGSGRFGDPDLVCHLTFEDGSGTSITDHSRINHSAIVTSGGWTWNSNTLRQVVTPVTGIHPFENARGRKWLILDIGNNHYRVPRN